MDLKIIITEENKEGLKTINIFDNLKKASVFYRNIMTDVEAKRYDGIAKVELVNLVVHF